MKTFDADRVQNVYSFVQEYIRRNGTAPSLRQIGSGCGISQPRTVSRVLQYLNDQGMVGFEYSGTRKYISVPQAMNKGETIKAYILGTCPCGPPIYAEENIEATVALPTEIFGREEHHILHAKGNSMLNCGIRDGDLMVFRPTDSAQVGNIVIARVNNDEATAKILAMENGRYYLKAANDALDENGERIYKDIFPIGEWDIIGIVDNVIHKLYKGVN